MTAKLFVSAMSCVVLGHFMLLDSSKGQTGDQVALFSPTLTLSASALLEFSYQMLLNATDTVGSLTLYRFSLLHTYDSVLFQVRGNRGEKWLSAEVCLGAGEYQLAFVGTVGLASLSDIAVDNIKVWQNEYCYEQHSSSEGSVTSYLLADNDERYLEVIIKLFSINLSLNDAIDATQNPPLWRLISTFGTTHS